MVLRRDQQPVFHNTRTPRGAWRHAPRRVLAALTALRGRLYTEQEAAVFLSTQAWLRQVLPPHQDELADITAQPLGSVSTPEGVPLCPKPARTEGDVLR